jgi:adenylate cyclase
MMSRQFWSGRVYIIAVILGALCLSALLDPSHGPQHWSADWATALLSKRPSAQDGRIALIYISDATLTNYPYVSPIDRQFLADVVRAVDQAEAKVIGLDVILDRKTEPQKDAALREALRRTKAKVVLAATDELPNDSRVQNYFFKKTGEEGPKVGHIYFDGDHSQLILSDHVVRFIAERPQKQPIQQSFAEVLALSAGQTPEPKSKFVSLLLSPKNYISWLLQPEKTETFMTLDAGDVLGLGSVKLPLKDMLRDKIVLIGGNFDDRDQHLTPLSVRDDRRYTGLFIHAQILAQILDRRFLNEVSYPLMFLMVGAAACIGYVLGKKSEHYHLWLELSSIMGLILIGVLSFLFANVIFPYATVALVWLASLEAGHAAHSADSAAKER